MALDPMHMVDDILDNGSEIPEEVTNRQLLRAIQKSYRKSLDNEKGIDRNLNKVMQIFQGDPEQPTKPGLFERLNIIEAWKRSVSTTLGRVGWIVAGAFLTSLVGVLIQLWLHSGG